MRVLGIDVSEIKIGVGPAAAIAVVVCGWIVTTMVWAGELEKRVLEQKAELLMKLQQQTHITESQQKTAELQQKNIDALIEQQRHVNDALIEISTELRLRRERER
jgi:hypothetical protein